MKAIMLMFDSLNRNMLAPYGGEKIDTPNLRRLAEHAVTFDRFYAGGLPCMPARRELHTGRWNFLHRCWGPLEPFDDSTPEILKKNGIYTHLITDHLHYFEDDGSGYHTRYSSWEFFRGQAGDKWKSQLLCPKSAHIGREDVLWDAYEANRRTILRREDFPQDKCFSAGIDFIETHSQVDNWFLQIECFDPHEPFFAPEEFLNRYPDSYDGIPFDWPEYKPVRETPEQVAHLHSQYAALVSYCDDNLGRILDVMDRKGLWKDTMLLLNTDHGFLLGEHGMWGKTTMPFYEELVHLPFFIWDPRFPRAGTRCQALATTIDIPATLLSFFGCSQPPDMMGIPLDSAIAEDAVIHDAILFGLHGGHVNVTDGRFTYMRAPTTPDNLPLSQYTLLPVPGKMFHLERLRDPGMRMVDPFSFTKGCQVVQLPCTGKFINNKGPEQFETVLFDLENDPGQCDPLCNEEVKERMKQHLIHLMCANDAPAEQYIRLGLSTAP